MNARDFIPQNPLSPATMRGIAELTHAVTGNIRRYPLHWFAASVVLAWAFYAVYGMGVAHGVRLAGAKNVAHRSTGTPSP